MGAMLAHYVCSRVRADSGMEGREQWSFVTNEGAWDQAPSLPFHDEHEKVA
jgi:hypothetical protein